MNPFNRMLSHLRPADSEEELSEEEQKQLRIQFHRENVRNGPVKSRYATTGQIRRTVDRGRHARGRKTNKRYRQSWMDNQAHLATLRGHLIILGVLECKHESTVFTEAQRKISMTWAVEKYGERDDEGAIVLGDEMVAKAVANAKAAFLTAMGVEELPDGTFVTNRSQVTA